MPLDRRPVASLWIGEELQYLNQLCLKSHLLHGHPVTLYCTDTLKNAPDGVEVRPASEIMNIDMKQVGVTRVYNVMRQYVYLHLLLGRSHGRQCKEHQGLHNMVARSI